MPESRSVRRFLRFVFGNPWYKLLSIVLAVAAWWYVQGGQDSEARVRVEVNWSLPKGLIPTEAPPSVVFVEVKGSRSATRRAQRAAMAIVADLSTVKAGEQTIDFETLPMTGLPRGVTVLRTTPAVLRIVLDEPATRKLRVAPVLLGEPSEGFAVMEATVEPSTVLVRGPRSMMAGLREVPTRPIDVTTLRGDADLPVEVELPWGFERVSSSAPTAHIEVEPTLDTRVFERVPVVVRPEGWRPRSASIQVTLQGPSALLATMDVEHVVALIDVTPGLSVPVEASLDGPDARVVVVHPSMDKVQVTTINPVSVELVKP